MKLTSLKATGFEGGEFKAEFGPVNVICGRNASGKTRVLNALRLGLLGYVPSLGKGNQDLMRLASEDTLSVGIEFDCGKRNAVVLKRDAKGKASKSEARTVEIPAMLLDIQEFYALTEQKRMQHICAGAMRDDDWSDGEVAKKIKAIGVAAPPEIANPVIDEVRTNWNTWVLERTGSVPDWLAEIVEEVKATLKQIKGEAPQLSAAMSVLKSETQVEAKDFGPQIAKTLAKGREDSDRLARIRTLRETATKTERTRTAYGLLVAAGPERRAALEKATKALASYEKAAKPGGSTGLALRDIAEGETIEIEVTPQGIKCEAIDFAYFNRLEAARRAVVDAQRLVTESTQAEQSLADLQPAEAGEYDDAALLAAEEAMRATQEALRGLQEAQGVFTRTQAARKRMEELEGQILATTARQQAWKAVLDVVEAEQGLLAERVFQRMLTTVNAFTEGFMPTIWYRNGEIGYWQTGNPVLWRINQLPENEPKGWVSHETFSGMERAVAYAGLGVALAAQTPCRVVMADEVMVDEVNKPKMVGRYQHLVKEGLLDNAILVEAVDTMSDDWKRLGRPAWMPKQQAAEVNMIVVK